MYNQLDWQKLNIKQYNSIESEPVKKNGITIEYQIQLWRIQNQKRDEKRKWFLRKYISKIEH